LPKGLGSSFYPNALKTSGHFLGVWNESFYTLYPKHSQKVYILGIIQVLAKLTWLILVGGSVGKKGTWSFFGLLAPCPRGHIFSLGNLFSLAHIFYWKRRSPWKRWARKDDLALRRGWSSGTRERDLEWWACGKEIVFREARARLGCGTQAGGSVGWALGDGERGGEGLQPSLVN
jgi:hypothetical protein